MISLPVLEGNKWMYVYIPLRRLNYSYYYSYSLTFSKNGSSPVSASRQSRPFQKAAGVQAKLRLHPAGLTNVSWGFRV